jgi:predicted  nucleic acid-binding Zn-ribbon protein
MSVTSQPLRRTLTVALVVAALLLGFVAIRTAAAWTNDSAPLVASPASAQTIEAALVDEQVRSADLQTQLSALTGQTEEMTAALVAAQARVVSDAKHAEDLAKDLSGANKKLKALEKSISAAAAASAASARSAAVRTTRTTSRPVSHDDGGGEHDD